jgi:hypothetical protein
MVGKGHLGSPSDPHRRESEWERAFPCRSDRIGASLVSIPGASTLFAVALPGVGRQCNLLDAVGVIPQFGSNRGPILLINGSR